MEISTLKQEVQKVVVETNEERRDTLAQNMLVELYCKCEDDIGKFHDFFDNLILDNDGVKAYVLIEKLAEEYKVDFTDMRIFIPSDKEQEYDSMSSGNLEDLIQEAKFTGYLKN